MSTQEVFAETRLSWLLLCVSALGLEAAALWFQYVTGLNPCVMCVYERLAVFGLVFAGLIGFIKPRWLLLRLLGYLLWAVSAGWGLLLAWEHVGFQKAVVMDCAFLPDFPAWMPLHDWMPEIFLPTGYCDEVQWQWLSLSMPEWMIVVFAIYLLILLFVLVAGVRRRFV